jgi:GTPase Era involved in 16S rRNA processing
MTDFIERQLQIKKPVDVVWYCVSAPSERITDADLKVIRALRKYKIPTAFILTQIDVATEECCEEMNSVCVERGNSILHRAAAYPPRSAGTSIQATQS